MTLDPGIAARLKRNADGLFAAVVQERATGAVLMMAWMNDEALDRTLRTREATYFSRSRGEQWVKGATSGHTQRVHSVRLDCDGDTVLLTVDQVGGACHTGDHTCFDADVLLADDDPTVADPALSDPASAGRALADPARAGQGGAGTSGDDKVPR